MKQVIVLRKDLNMRKGKMVAQGAHASMAAILDTIHVENGEFERIVKPDIRIHLWLSGKFTKICVSVDSEEELRDIYGAAEAEGMICSLIKDSGLTEFKGIPTYTAAAVGPDYDEKIDEITGHLKLL